MTDEEDSELGVVEEDDIGCGVDDALGALVIGLEEPLGPELEEAVGNGMMMGVGDDEEAVDCGVGFGGIVRDEKDERLLSPVGTGTKVSVGDDEKVGETIGVGAGWTVSVTVTVTVTVTGSGTKVTVTGAGVTGGALPVGAGVGPPVATGDSEPPYV